jgi:hypothetical protein
MRVSIAAVDTAVTAVTSMHVFDHSAVAALTFTWLTLVVSRSTVTALTSFLFIMLVFCNATSVLSMRST